MQKELIKNIHLSMSYAYCLGAPWSTFEYPPLLLSLKIQYLIE